MEESEIYRLLREIEEREGRNRPEDELPDDGTLPGWDDDMKDHWI